MKILQAIRNNIPNCITCLNLFCGAVAVIFALKGSEVTAHGSLTGYQCAFIFILLAAVFDFLDGLVARILNVVSAIGKELDSLCDCVSFGLAPAMILFALMRETWPECHHLPLVALVIAIFGALRLARFNTDTTQTTTFRGLPIPANAVFWIGFCNWFAHNPAILHPAVLVVIIVAESYLMLCPLRMYSLKLKNLRPRDNAKVYLTAVAAVFLLAFLGWDGMALGVILYLILSALPDFGGKKSESGE